MNNITRTIIAGGIGSMLEMYDFVIYILVSAILAKLFFPASNQFDSLLMTYGAFAAGFIARPFGSLLFGHLGDRLGRKKVLLWTIFLMAISTGCIALMPSYQKIGLIAPILIVLCRLVQGIAVGGEFAGAMTFVAEHASPQYRGFVTSWMFFFINMGIMLASGTSSLFTHLITHLEFAQWGWRILFLIGSCIAVLGMLVRNKINETPLFNEAKSTRNISSAPLKLLFNQQRPSLYKGIAITICAAVFVGMVLMYMPNYLVKTTSLRLPSALMINTISLLILSCLIPVFGWLSDRVGRKKIMLGGGVGLLVTAWPLFFIIHNHYTYILLPLIILDIFGAALLGTIGAMLTELALTASRYSMVAFSYNIPFALFTGTVPLVSLFLMHRFHNEIVPALYLSLSAVITLVALGFITECKGRPLR